jgi:3-oxoacyl-[acyl-carrier-protein] synthase II
MSSLPRRVVITGASVGTALGFDLDSFWTNLLAGHCGISRVPHVADDSPLPVKVAGCIPDAALTSALAKFQLDDPDRANQLALFAVGAALADAGLPTNGANELPHDLILGTGHGNVEFCNSAAVTYATGGYRKLRPTTIVRAMFNRPANVASIRFRLTGSSFVLSCACATGSLALGDAFLRVRFGLTDCAIAACADTGLDLTTFSAWNRIGVLSKIPDPTAASRPFDAKRDGLVMGEGAAGFVVESLESAQQRGARIWAEIVGYGSTCDAKHIVVPDSVQQVRAVRQTLAMAGLAPEDIGYVNAHGTATDLADVVEAATLRTVFGAHTDQVPVSNTKAQLGHLMGATAGVELVATLLALKHGVLPPCRNLDEPDPRCALNFVRHEPQPARVEFALKNSFAFGGTNCALVLRRWG